MSVAPKNMDFLPTQQQQGSTQGSETMPGWMPNTALDYASGRASMRERNTGRITLAAKSIRQRSAAAVPTGPIAPGQSTPQGKTLAFIPIADKNVLGYNVYRSTINNPITGNRIMFISQPPDAQQVSISDNPQVAGTYYYWASSANASGAESARIGLGSFTQTVPSGVQPPYTVTFASTIFFDITKGHTQQITLIGDVTDSSIIGTFNLGDTLLLYIFQDSTGGHLFSWPPNIVGGIQPILGSGPNQRTKALLQWDGTAWELVYVPSIV